MKKSNLKRVIGIIVVGLVVVWAAGFVKSEVTQIKKQRVEIQRFHEEAIITNQYFQMLEKKAKMEIDSLIWADALSGENDFELTPEVDSIRKIQTAKRAQK